MVKKTLKNIEEVSIFLVNERLYIHNLVVETIMDCLINGDDNRVVIEFTMTDNDSVFRVNMGSKDWKESLNLSLDYFSLNDNFEKCIQIRELLKKIDEKI